MVQAIKRDEAFIDPEGIHLETTQPERRWRKPPILLVHGALTGSWLWSSYAAYFAERGWEAHALNLRGHFTSEPAELDETSMHDYADDIGVAVRHLGRPPVIIGWGIGALAAMLYAERNPVLGLVLLAPSPPAAALPRRPDEHELRAVPDIYDAAWWGWIAPMDKLREWMPDMEETELSKMQELLAGARESGSARRERMRGVAVDVEPDRGAVAGHRGGSGRRHPSGGGASGRGPAQRRLRVRARCLALRAGDGLGDVAAGRAEHPRLAGGAAPGDARPTRRAGRRARRSALEQRGLRRRGAFGTLGRRSSRTHHGPHSSRGPGHRPLKAEITGSNPVCGTNTHLQA